MSFMALITGLPEIHSASLVSAMFMKIIPLWLKIFEMLNLVLIGHIKLEEQEPKQRMRKQMYIHKVTLS